MYVAVASALPARGPPYPTSRRARELLCFPNVHVPLGGFGGGLAKRSSPATGPLPLNWPTAAADGLGPRAVRSQQGGLEAIRFTEAPAAAGDALTLALCQRERGRGRRTARSATLSEPYWV